MKEKEKEFLLAVKKGDFEKVEELLRENKEELINIKAPFSEEERLVKNMSNRLPEGYTALHLAVQHISNDNPNKEKIVNLLLESGANVDETISNRKTPLHLAVVWATDSIIKILVDKGADVNKRDNKKQTPIHLTISLNRPRILEILLNSNNVNLLTLDNNNDKNTYLHLAVQARNIEMVEALLKHQAKGKNFVNKKNNIEYTALFIAADRGEVNTYIDGNGVTSVKSSVSDEEKQDRLNYMKLLILYGADPEIKNPVRTSFERVIEEDDRKQIESFYKSLKLLKIENDFSFYKGLKLLEIANDFESRDYDLMIKLLYEGANVNILGPLHDEKYKGTVLHHMILRWNAYSENSNLLEEDRIKIKEICELIIINPNHGSYIEDSNQQLATQLAKHHGIDWLGDMMKSVVEEQKDSSDDKNEKILNWIIDEINNYPPIRDDYIFFAIKKNHIKFMEVWITEVNKTLQGDITERLKNAIIDRLTNFFHFALQQEKFDLIKLFIEKGVELERRVSHKNAIKGNAFEIAETISDQKIKDYLNLLKYNIQLNQSATDGEFEEFKKILEAKEELLKNNPEFKDQFNWSLILEKAVKGNDKNKDEAGNINILEYALSKIGYKTKIENPLLPFTLVKLAVDLKRPQTLKALFDFKVEENYFVNPSDLQSEGKLGDYLLHAAVKEWQYEIVKLLIEKGKIDVNSMLLGSQFTPLQIAIFSTKNKPVQAETRIKIIDLLLLQENLEINKQMEFEGKPHQTAAHLAASLNDSEMLKKLIDKGADLTIKDVNGETPFDLIKDNAVKEEIEKYIKGNKFEAEPELPLPHEVTPDSPKPSFSLNPPSPPQSPIIAPTEKSSNKTQEGESFDLSSGEKLTEESENKDATKKEPSYAPLTAHQLPDIKSGPSSPASLSTSKEGIASGASSAPQQKEFDTPPVTPRDDKKSLLTKVLIGLAIIGGLGLLMYFTRADKKLVDWFKSTKLSNIKDRFIVNNKGVEANISVREKVSLPKASVNVEVRKS
ncbi:MAG: ankyrin repeat domain-containing protein [Sphingobacteriia bacterium]|nr:ankyrin repeat domain-containing protein [Sphingobacteriia bacterium]